MTAESNGRHPGRSAAESRDPVSQTWDAFGRGIAFHQTAKGIPPIVVQIGDWPAEIFGVGANTQLVAGDSAKPQMRYVSFLQDRYRLLQIFRRNRNDDA